MSQRRSRIARAVTAGLCASAAAVEFLLAAEACAAGVVSTWNPTATNVWSSASNWVNVPVVAFFPNNGNGGQTYDAVINAGNVTLDVDITIQKLTLSNTGTLQGASNLTALELFTFSGGTLMGSGALNATAGVTMSANNRTFTQRTLNASNTSSWTAGSINTGLGATFNNSGTFTTNFNGNWVNNQGGSTTFNNAGEFRKTAGTGSTVMNVIFNNTGSVFADTGTISFTSGGSATGSFTAASGATIDFFAGTYNLLSGATFAGAGSARATGATVSVIGNVPATNFDFSAGTLNGGGTFTPANLTWTGGTMTGTGVTTIAAGATLNLAAVATKVLTQRTLNNAGTTLWSAGSIASGLGAVVNNSGTFTASFDGTFDNSQGNPTTLFNNSGVYTKSAGSGTNTIGVFFNNTGAVNVASGNLRFTVGGTSTGAFNLAAGTSVEFNSGVFNLNGGSITGQGTARISAGTLRLNATAPADRVQQTGGVLDGIGNLVVTNLYDWQGGTVTGAGGALTITNAANLLLAGGSKTLTQRTISNSGTATWSAGAVESGVGAVFNNAGTFTTTFDGAFSNSQGNPPTAFNNTGTFTKSAGTGTTSFGTFFNNAGTANVNAGTLSLNGGGTSIGRFVVAPGATLAFGGGTQQIDNATSIVTGGGTVVFSAGTVNFNPSSGAFTPAVASVANGTANFNSGTIAMPATVLISAGTLNVHSALTGTNWNFTGGTLGGSGTASVPANGEIALGGVLKVLTVKNFVNNGNATWTAGQISAGLGSIITSNGTFTATFNGTLTSDQGGAQATFANVGNFVKSGATGITTLNLAFNNAGTATAAAGTIAISQGGFATGRFTATAGATIDFTAGAYTLNPGATFTGQGLARALGATLSLGIGADVPFVNLEQTAGTITGQGNMSVGSQFHWTGGTLTVTGGGTPAVNLLPGSLATVDGPGTKVFTLRSINNAGNVTWTAGVISTGLGAVFNNSGAMTVGFDGNFSSDQGGTRASFNNTGVLTKSAGTATATFSTFFNNSGTVNVNAGTLAFSGGGSANAAFTAAANTAIDFTAGTYTLTNAASFPGAGTARVSNATLVTAGDIPANIFEQTGGTLDGGGRLTAANLLSWTGGSMNGTGVTAVAPAAAFTLAGVSKAINQRTLSNSGTATWSAGLITASLSAVINNSGTFATSFDGSIANGGGPAPISAVNNTGTFSKTGGSGTTSVAIAFNNNGTVLVNTGSLQLGVGGTSTGSFTIAGAAAALHIAGGTHNLTSTSSLSGPGAFTQTGGTVNHAGTYDVDTTSISNATFNMLPGASPGLRVLRTKSLAITPSGKLDLSNNHAVVDYAASSPIATIRAAIISAYVPASANHWTGNGLTSSAAAANPATALGYAEAADVLGAAGGTFAGQAVDASAVLVRYTLFGDATLDGAVDFNDLVRLAQNYNVVDGNRVRSTGDFTYDGNTDFNDLVKLAQNYNTSLPAPPVQGASAEFDGDLARAFATVPEPIALSAAGLLLLTCSLTRRRRRSSVCDAPRRRIQFASPPVPLKRDVVTILPVMTSEHADGADRRSEPRTRHTAVVIMVYGEGENLQFEPAELVDCSPSGISILFNRALPPGGNFLLKLKVKRMTLVSYAVRSCTPAGKQFRIGGQFTHFVGPDEDLPADEAYKALLAS